jgi:hypothetical protein
LSTDKKNELGGVEFDGDLHEAFTQAKIKLKLDSEALIFYMENGRDFYKEEREKARERIENQVRRQDKINSTLVGKELTKRKRRRYE